MGKRVLGEGCGHRWPRPAPLVAGASPASVRDSGSNNRHSGSTSQIYRGTSLTRKRNPLSPYRRPMPKVLEGSSGRILMFKIPLEGPQWLGHGLLYCDVITPAIPHGILFPEIRPSYTGEFPQNHPPTKWPVHAWNATRPTSSGSVACPRGRLYLTDTLCSLSSFRKSNHPQNRQLNILISDCNK